MRASTHLNNSPQGVFVALLCLFVNAAASAQTVTFLVNTFADTADANPGDGIAADVNGQTSVRAAIMEANRTAGVVNINFGINGYFFLTRAGVDDACSVGDLDINPTAGLTELNINGNAGGFTTISCAGLPAPPNRDRVFHIPSTAPSGLIVRLSGLVLRDGNASGTTGSLGGGVLVQSGRIELQNVEIQECSAALDGGAFWSNRNVTVNQSSLTMRQNNAGRDGGGLYLAGPAIMNGGIYAESNVAATRGGGARIGLGATAYLPDVVLQFNQATQGGGMANSGNTLIDFFIAVQNQATGGGNGGAVANQNSGVFTIRPTVQCHIASNHADNAGGAINNQSGCTLILDQAALRENHATNLGGAISNSGDVTATRCEFSGNRSDGLIISTAGGGAVYNQTGPGIVRAVNCTFSANRAPNGVGGAIANDFNARCELSSCTLRENQASLGDSLYNGNTSGSVSVMKVLSTVLDNAPWPPGNNVVAPSIANSAGYNINVDGTGMVPANSDQFGTIAAPITTQLTALLPCGLLRAHYPMPNSPAVDRGACFDLAGGLLGDDQGRHLRPQDGDGDGVASCDVGAVEMLFNDTCSNAPAIVAATTLVNNSGATTDGPAESCGFTGQPGLDGDVWYTFTAPCNAIRHMKLTAAAGSPGGRLLGVYAGCPQTGGALIGCAAGPGSATASVSFTTVAGQVYVIRTGGLNGAQGIATLVVESCPGDFAPPPFGDCLVNVNDLLYVINHWGTYGVTQLLIVINNWGSCP